MKISTFSQSNKFDDTLNLIPRIEVANRTAPLGHSLCNPQPQRTMTLAASKLPIHSLLVEGLGVGGGGRNVGIASSLVRASGELELVGGLEVGIAGGAVGGGVILEVEKESEHF
jgi:hypothetical protein